jgi:serine/threonine protein kinase
VLSPRHGTCIGTEVMHTRFATLLTVVLVQWTAVAVPCSSASSQRRVPPWMVKVGSDSSPGDLLGQDFGPYRLVRRLGVGGMAQTFEAVRQGPSGFSQRVCLKLVLPFFRGDQVFAELFEREARLAARLRHSNIVGVIDFGDIDGTLYIALELVDGADLQVLLDAQDRKRLAHDFVVLIGRDLARGLEHAHNPPAKSADDGADASAIIHRDISPSNVLISRHGEVMLTDFGVAKAVTDTWGKQSNVKGKIPYMSPEQLMGEPLDGRADLFAVGVVLFEALTGKRPYAGANEPATIMAALAGNHVPLVELAPDAPPGLRRVIERLLEPDRERRPASAAALVELLDEIAPPPRIRRELGTMVTRTPAAEAERVDTGVKRTGGTAAEVEELGLGEAATAPAKGDAKPTETATPTSRRELLRRAGWALLALGGVGGGALVLWPDDERSPKHEPAGTRQPGTKGDEAEEAQPPDPGARSEETDQGQRATSSARPPSDRAPDATPHPKAHLTVAVFPWGEVWINGKPRGTAPLKNQALKPGVYKVSAGQGAPSKTKTVRLGPGQRKTVVFDLTSSKP